MPSTITTYYEFLPGTKARSSQVNTNFANYRGDILPINENTASSSDNTHYLGAPDHYWAGVYSAQVDLRSSTSTATLVMRGDTSKTTGAFVFEIEGVQKAYLGASGMSNDSLEPSARTTIATTYTANGSFTVPAGITQVDIELWPAGGGGGSGAGVSGGGGAGGGGSFMYSRKYAVTGGDVLSITVGAGGAGGAATTGAGVAGASGGASMVHLGSNMIIMGPGAAGGGGGSAAGGGSFSSRALTGLYGLNHQVFAGGAGGAVTTSGTAGEASLYQSATGAGGAGGTSKGGGGGGGGSSYGVGGRGQDGTTTGNAPANNFAAGYGAGGGGGCGHGTGGSPDSGGAGASGGAGLVIVYYTKTT